MTWQAWTVAGMAAAVLLIAGLALWDGFVRDHPEHQPEPALAVHQHRATDALGGQRPGDDDQWPGIGEEIAEAKKLAADLATAAAGLAVLPGGGDGQPNTREVEP